MSGIVLTPDTPETRKALQDKARHDFILKMYQEIRIDMEVCKIEGWDKMEFIRMLFEVLNHFMKTRKRALMPFRKGKEAEGQMSFLDELEAGK